MHRRVFVALGITALTGPLTAQAQAVTIARVGFLSPTNPPSSDLSHRLQALGWTEGSNLIFESRSAQGRIDRLPSLAADLVRAKVHVIVAVSPPAIKAARGATQVIPIVMAFSGIDPVRAGFVASLARPGGNVTGLAILATDVTVKRLELLKETLPRASRIVVLVNPRNPSTAEQLAALRTAAPRLGVELQPVEIARSGEYGAAFAVTARTQANALIVPSDPEFARDRQRLVDLAAQRSIPAVYEWALFVEVGGLMSYGPSLDDLTARVAVYVDKILRGAKPADLPVEHPTTFELAVNLKTARALGITIPPSLLLRADQVIE